MEKMYIIEKQIKSAITIGERTSLGFVYTKEFIEEVFRQQTSLIRDRKLFIKQNDNIEGVVTKAEITEDNKITYTVAISLKDSLTPNLYLSNIPLQIGIPVKIKIEDNKLCINTMSYVNIL